MRLMKFEDLQKIVPNLKLITESNSTSEILSICDLDFPSQNGLLFIKNKKYLNRVLESKLPVLGIILSEKLESEAKDLEKFNPLFVATATNIDLAVSFLSKPFYELKYSSILQVEAKIAASAKVHEGAFVGKDVSIGENTVLHPGAVVMDNCVIGSNCVLYPNTSIYPFVEMGDDVRIHSGSVIGADGFGYNHDAGVHHKVWHMGGVKIGNSVEVGANSQIDGGTFSPTVIGDGTKLDNNVQIGHNCRLGRGVMICGHVAIGGSSYLDDYTVFGGKSGMGDNMKLGKGCQVAGGALVNTDWPDGTVLGGHPARPLKEWMRGIAFVRKESLKKK